MDDIIKQCINDYKADLITWHDIQDIVGGYILKTYGIIDYNTDKDKWRKVHLGIEENMLQEIEKAIY